jgi:hypothetical protein
MNEISYITSAVLQTFSDHPGRLVKALEYACALTLLIAIVSDSLLRRRRPARQEKSSESPRPLRGRGAPPPSM